jgi:hypothetical protein
MKELVTLLVGVSCICTAQAQTTKPPESVMIIGQVYYQDASQTLKRLPEEQWKAVGHGGLFTTATGSIELDGAASSFRIPANVEVSFVFIVGNPEAVSLRQFVQKKSRREVETVDVGHTGTKIVHKQGLPIEIVKNSESSFKLTTKPLPPGEYAVLTEAKVFSFGVDPPR